MSRHFLRSNADWFGNLDLWHHASNEKEISHGRVAVANTLNLFWDGAVGFIDRLDWQRGSRRADVIYPLTDPRKPPPADLREVRSVRWIFPQEVLLYDASEHEEGDES